MEKKIDKIKPVILILKKIILGGLAICSFLLGAFVFLRDEGFLPEPANSWQLRGLIGELPWYWFIIFGLLVLLVSTLIEVIRLAIKNQDVKIIIGIKNFELKNKIYHLIVPRLEEKAIEVFISKEKIRQLNRNTNKKSSDNLELATKNYLSQKVGEMAEEVVNDFRDALSIVGFKKAVDHYIKDLQELLLTRTEYANLIEVLPTFINKGIKESKTNIIRFVLSNNLRFPTKDELITLGSSHERELPKEPEINKNYFGDFGSSSNKIYFSGGNFIPLNSNNVNVIRNIEGPRYDSEKEIHYEVGKMIPKVPINDVSSFYIWVDRLGDTDVVEIKIIINSADLPETKTQVIRLKFQFEKEEFDQSKFFTGQPSK